MMILNHCYKARSLILAAALIGGLSLVNHANGQTRLYLVDLNSRTITEFGTLRGNSTVPEEINNSGQVVGKLIPDGGDIFLDSRAFITGPNGKGIRDLGTPAGTASDAQDINDAGQVAGSYLFRTDYPYRNNAFITGPDGTGIRDLGKLSGANISSAEGINNAGQVVGISGTEDNLHAFITGPNGVGMRDLHRSSWNQSFANDINDGGQVAGNYLIAEDPFFPFAQTSHAFITGPDGTGVRGIDDSGWDSSYAAVINEAGQVVGSLSAEGVEHAFITGPDGVGTRVLGTLGGTVSSASDINDAGQVVGVSYTPGGDFARPFITGADGTGMMDLNSLVDLPKGVILTAGFDINNNGQVIALGIPEPSIYVLMLAGLVLVGLFARRKKAENPWMNMGSPLTA